MRLAQERDELRVVADQRGSPTSTRDLAAAILRIAPRLAAGEDIWGTYHFTGAGVTTWHGFAEAIVAAQAPLTGRAPKVTPITTADYPTAAVRPANSVLDCSRFERVFGLRPRPWAEEAADITRRGRLAQQRTSGPCRVKASFWRAVSGTRLHPLTLVTSKQLLPVYDKPMIYYPLSSLMLAGIREILIITTPHDQPAFKICSGAAANGDYSSTMPSSQSRMGSLRPLSIGEDFLRGHPSCLILGDNILYGHGLPELIAARRRRYGGANHLWLFGR